MRLSNHYLRILGSSILVAVVVASAGCRSSDRSAGQAINDKMTAFHVERALADDAVLKYPDVKVHVYNGRAQLSGFANTEEQRTRAAELAAGVQGVNQVINEISLKPEPTGRAPIKDVGQPAPR